MYWLLQGSQPGDSLVFHYSGHGAQQRSYSGDEVDGMDETLCPLDFEIWNFTPPSRIHRAVEALEGIPRVRESHAAALVRVNAGGLPEVEEERGLHAVFIFQSAGDAEACYAIRVNRRGKVRHGEL